MLLWQDSCSYEALFKLLAPDHVLDAERVHARWQRLYKTKQILKLQTMSASLCLIHYMEHQQNFPAIEDWTKVCRMVGRAGKPSVTHSHVRRPTHRAWNG